MKPSRAAGIESTARITVVRERAIDFMGEVARVYATTMRVHEIEVTCRARHSRCVVDAAGTAQRRAAKARQEGQAARAFRHTRWR